MKEQLQKQETVVNLLKISDNVVWNISIRTQTFMDLQSLRILA